MSVANWFVFGLTILFLVYFVYATPIIMLGVWRYKKRGFGEDPGEDWDPPNVSVLVPVKNEEKVVGRLLDALVRLDYPKENLEVVVVEDESRDRTLEICRSFSAKHPWIKVFHRDSSLGKGDALNFAFHQSSGEIVATFDADDVPEEQAVKKALRYFNSPETGAVHGFHRTLNLRESIVSRLAAYENFLYRLSNDGKYALRLFVTFSGSNTFFRRTALEKVGLWDPKSLVEDAELSVRFARAHIATRLAPVECWQEMPARVGSLFKQRIRWSGGNMLTGVKHWNAWRSMSLAKTLDMEALMMSPILAVLTFAAWIILGLGIVKVGLPFETLLPLFIVMVAVNIVYVGTLVAAVVSSARSSMLSHLGLLLATYPYAALVSLANLAAMILILRRGARLWLKTEKTGYVDKPLQLGSS
ncbi:glycosyltransferase family 2 protein [Candidatus Bathyarchaeota archaeon]|nr:MAG: glycosyltransferase family 2 protein [Candidatus Bathyarchaeota archaeon]